MVRIVANIRLPGGVGIKVGNRRMPRFLHGFHINNFMFMLWNFADIAFTTADSNVARRISLLLLLLFGAVVVAVLMAGIHTPAFGARRHLWMIASKSLVLWFDRFDVPAVRAGVATQAVGPRSNIVIVKIAVKPEVPTAIFDSPRFDTVVLLSDCTINAKTVKSIRGSSKTRHPKCHL